jgi:NAD(P)-dependent dehydrogenase (short-subunit alcohol dehydrogenase family)
MLAREGGAMERPVLVTGANSGIGLATALELARRGFRAIGSVRSEAKADAVREAATEANVEVETVLLDVTDAAACERVVEQAGPLYGLVNNAGFGGTGAIEEVSDEEARQMLETMVVAPARLARLALRGMRERGGGRIVNVSSIYGLTTTPLSGWYQACKHALEGLSDALRMEVASDGVQVVLVEPGGIRTAIWEGVQSTADERAGSRYAAAYRRTAATTRLSRPLMGDPATVARVIARALDARFPRARYLVGPDAQALALVERLTPTALKDRLSRLMLGL